MLQRRRRWQTTPRKDGSGDDDENHGSDGICLSYWDLHIVSSYLSFLRRFLDDTWRCIHYGLTREISKEKDARGKTGIGCDDVSCGIDDEVCLVPCVVPSCEAPETKPPRDPRDCSRTLIVFSRGTPRRDHAIRYVFERQNGFIVRIDFRLFNSA